LWVPFWVELGSVRVAIAIWVNSVWLLATLVEAVALIHYAVIRREEQYLERKFGAQLLGL
jgi:protein-S-isoprenylcysteine O-methyltransferase Ste14